MLMAACAGCRSSCGCYTTTLHRHMIGSLLLTATRFFDFDALGPGIQVVPRACGVMHMVHVHEKSTSTTNGNILGLQTAKARTSAGVCQEA